LIYFTFTVFFCHQEKEEKEASELKVRPKDHSINYKVHIIFYIFKVRVKYLILIFFQNDIV